MSSLQLAIDIQVSYKIVYLKIIKYNMRPRLIL